MHRIYTLMVSALCFLGRCPSSSDVGSLAYLTNDELDRRLA
jgi:hypothetical protein